MFRETNAQRRANRSPPAVRIEIFGNKRLLLSRPRFPVFIGYAAKVFVDSRAGSPIRMRQGLIDYEKQLSYGKGSTDRR